ncbi:hypothetical protein D1AOALGA4SA_4308 [Olavius algarvensis Delta 1 endosymbiont]|nr:hypothetical protein D1AOALGA4SA_4308 [Olavius algarvensis Delta 1 endosymbiont]
MAQNGPIQISSASRNSLGSIHNLKPAAYPLDSATCNYLPNTFTIFSIRNRNPATRFLFFWFYQSEIRNLQSAINIPL